MVPNTAPDTYANAGTLQEVAVDNVLGFLSNTRQKMPKDDLVKLVSEFYSAETIKTATATYYQVIPDHPDSRIRRKFSNDKKDNVATIYDLMEETPSDTHPLLVCRDICRTLLHSLGSIDNVTLYEQCTSLKREINELRLEQEAERSESRRDREKENTEMRRILT